VTRCSITDAVKRFDEDRAEDREPLQRAADAARRQRVGANAAAPLDLRA